MPVVSDFEDLTPDTIISAVEKAIECPMTGLTSPLPSYINRVYELQARDGARVVAKFYRPGRWSEAALRDEHAFVQDCADDEIPVVCPRVLAHGDTLDRVGPIHFAVFDKRSGREMEILDDEDWRRLGRLIGRIHVAGARRSAPDRIRLHPMTSLAADLVRLIDGGFVTASYESTFRRVTAEILALCEKRFDDVEYIRLHGDCHLKNFLHRPGEGIMIIDFDDMLTGPPVQDLWLLLPDHPPRCRREIHLLLEGYEQFREFDDRTLSLIEPLRAMRMIYFLAWCSKQAGDFKFKTLFPDWGSDRFWMDEIRDLDHQLGIMKKERLTSPVH